MARSRFTRTGGTMGRAAGDRSAAVQVAQLSLLTAGEEAVPRLMMTNEDRPASGTLHLTYFTARKTETITKVETHVSGGAASGLTLARIGIYQVAANGGLTLVASTPNDVTLWAATNTPYQKTFSVPWAKLAGQRYASGILGVGTTLPILECIPVRFQASGFAPRVQGEIAAADLPASVADAALSNQYRVFQAYFLP
jgi:hypothetical protein